MAEGDDDQERSEEPTQKKLDEARKRGDVPKSQEVNNWFLLSRDFRCSPTGWRALCATKEPRREKSYAFVLCYVTFAREETAFYRLMFEGNLPSMASEPEELRVRSLFAEYARLQSDRMGLDVDVDRMGELLWSTLHGAVVFQRMGRIGGRDFERLADNVLASVVAADLPATALGDPALRPHADNGARDWSGDLVSAERASPPLM